MSGRRIAKSSINWKRVIFYYIVFGFLLYRGILFLFTTDYFSLREVHIEGTKVLSPNYIVSLAKLKAGMNLLLIDTSKIKKDIKKSPWVESVIIKKKFFHKIFIKIEERVPFCILTNKKESLVLSDRCVALTRDIDRFYFLRKIIWKKLAISRISLGKRIENRWVCDSIYIMKIFDHEFPGLLKGIEIAEEAYIKLYMKNGLTIVASGLEDIRDKKKFVMLKKIVKTRSKTFKVLDLRYKKGIIGK